MTNQLIVKTIYTWFLFTLAKLESGHKAYSTLVLDRWAVLFSVHGTVVSLRITVLSLNLSRWDQRTQLVLEPRKTKMQITVERFSQRFATIHNKSALCAAACVIWHRQTGVVVKPWQVGSKLNTQTTAGRLIAMTADHLVICFLSFQHILQYSNRVHTRIFMKPDEQSLRAVFFERTRLVRDTGFTHTNVLKWVTFKLWILILINTP